jgi:arylsulfatase A-like enzyme
VSEPVVTQPADPQLATAPAVGRTADESTPWWPAPTRPGPGAPNVVLVVLDDVGFGDLGCYGSELRTPTIDGLAADGLRFNQFHTTTLCSPTRACLLTGRNHHSVGMGMVAEWDAGFDNSRSRITPAAATLPQLLRDAGYGTTAVGKWHLVPPHEQTQVGPFANWPLGKGFERHYGFLGGSTDQFFPELVRDNTLIEPPARPEDGYHLTTDLVDQSLAMLTDHLALAPDRPFFHYLAFGAAHWPLQAPPDVVGAQRGRFDRGWDVHRAERFARQQELGIVPASAALPPRNPGVRPWDELSDDERTFAARLQEAYAAVVEHTDAQLGRLVDFLRTAAVLDDTLFVLVSDNGASQEGGATGYLHFSRLFNLQPSDLADGIEQLDAIGGPTVQPAYPWGWAQVSNTPLKRYKGNTHGGGIRDPLIIRWPKGITDGGAVRSQFHHAIDVMPTILELTGIDAPTTYAGVEQLPIHGTSLTYAFAGDGPSTRTEQHFEMGGHRALYQDGWKAVTFHHMHTPLDADVWELYHLAEDYSEITDLAATEPGRVQAMQARWWELAEQYGVLPVDDRLIERLAMAGPPGSTRRLETLTFHPGATPVPGVTVPNTTNRSFALTVELKRCGAGDQGVLVRHGSVSGGYVLYVADGQLVLDHNRFGERTRLATELPAPVADDEVSLTFTKTGSLRGHFALGVGGDERARTEPIRTMAITFGGVFAIGADNSSPVSPSYAAPFPFTGEIGTVHVELGDDQEPITLIDLID